MFCGIVFQCLRIKESDEKNEVKSTIGNVSLIAQMDRSVNFIHISDISKQRHFEV